MLEDNEALKKYVALSRSIGVMLILIHILIYFWKFFFALGFSHEIYQFFAERMLAKSPNVFDNTWTLKTIGVLLIFCLGGLWNLWQER
ncbi:MAG: YWFCY domain-containing protein [Emticicia sp.]|nr:YWFCY domain-containing protein [Emticicia sp.]